MKFKTLTAMIIAITLIVIPTFAAMPNKSDVNKYLAAQEVRKVLFDGERKTMSPMPVISGGKVMVPMNWVNTQFGGTAVINPNKTVTLTLGSKTSTVQTTGFFSTVKISGGQVYVPASTVGAAYGYEVDWSKYTKTLFIDRIITDYVAYYREVAADPVKGTQLSTLSLHTIDDQNKIHLAGRKDLTSWQPMVPDTAFLPNASEALIKMAPYQVWASRGFVDFQRSGEANMVNGAGFDPEDISKLTIWLWNNDNKYKEGYIAAYMTQNLFDGSPDVGSNGMKIFLSPEYERALKYATRAQFGKSNGAQIYNYLISNYFNSWYFGIPEWSKYGPKDLHEKNAKIGGIRIKMWNYGGSDLNFYFYKK